MCQGKIENFCLEAGHSEKCLKNPTEKIFRPPKTEAKSPPMYIWTSGS